MSVAQDRAEACIRPTITVEGIVILPEWPGYARRIAAALEGVERLSWGALREAFGENYDGPFGGDLVVRHLTRGGVIDRVFWNIETGEEALGPSLEDFLLGMHGEDKAERERWRAWAEEHAMGYRLAAFVAQHETSGAEGAERG